jgi:apolipoprotein N-acyltransferase
MTLATATDRPPAGPTEADAPAPERSTPEPAPAQPRIRSRAAAAALAVAAGGLIALSLPPAGWWPAAFVGVAIWDRLLQGAPWRTRLARTYLLALVWYAPTITWSADLSGPGYLLAVTGMSVYVAVAGLATPPGRGRRLVLPGAVVLAQHAVGIYPWGGIPVAHLAMTQAGSCAPPCTQVDSPLIDVARLGGHLLLIVVVVIAGQALAALADVVVPALRRARPDRTVMRAAAAGVAVVVAVTAAGAVSPSGEDVGPLRMAVVQGGGPQRTPPGNGDSLDVFARHLAATRGLIGTPVDVVVWPENTVVVGGTFVGSSHEATLSELARELQATLIVGITEDDLHQDAFRNASIVIRPDGTTGERYDKVHRVPFGEFVPMRSFVERLVPPGAGLPERDAIAGTGSGRLDTPVGTMGVVISFEDFFAGRARDAIGSGGEVLLNPTNGASYWLTQVQTQQIASSRLRAVETGRWHLQAAPTGFSSVISPDGVLLDRTDISETAALTHTVMRRTGHTPATILGPWPVLALAVLAVAGGWWWSRRAPAS